MTATTLPAPPDTTGEPESPEAKAERRRQAAATWLDSGGQITPVALGRLYGKSRGWARGVIEQARQSQQAATVAEPEPAPPPAAATVEPEAPGRHWADTTNVLLVALVAAAASYGHMLEVALLGGEPLWLARAFPITVDGLALAALRRGEEGRGWLALALVVSVAGNVLSQFPEAAATAGPIVSAWPPLALYGTHRLLHGR